MQAPDFKTLLKQVGLKATPGKLALLGILASEEKPFSVERLKEELDVNEVTLYRALEALVNAHLIRRVDLGHSHAHYEFEKKHHHHLVCTECGTIEDVRVCPLPELKHSRKFKSIYAHSLEFFGQCKSCSMYNL